MKRWVGSYWDKGTRKSFVVAAGNLYDAHKMMDARFRLCGATIDGELIADIPVKPITLAPVGIVARIWCWVRNMIW